MNISGNKLAKMSGVSQSAISGIENGTNQPTVDTLERICSALGISLADFFAEDLEAMPPDLRRLLNVSKELTPSERALLTQFLEQLTSRRREGSGTGNESEVSEADIQVDRIAAHLEGEYGVHDPAMARFLRAVIVDVIREYDEMQRKRQES